MIGDRLKELRKILGLTQQEFADKLGIKRNAIATYEVGKSNPGDSVVALICSKFSVSESWLRAGEGDPFLEKSREEQIRDYFSDLEGLSGELKDRLLDALAAIRPEDWKLIEQLVNRIVAESRRDDAAPSAGSPSADSDTLTPDEREMLRQYREKKNQAEGSSASSAG